MESLCCLIQYASEALVLAHFGHKATYAILILLAASMNIIDEIHLLPTAVRLQLIRIFELVLERYGYLFSHSFITKARQLHEKLMEGYPPAARRSAKDGVSTDVEKWQKFLSITTNTNSLFQHLGENCCWRWLRVTDRSHKRLIDVSKFVKFILKFQLEFDFESIVAICIMCWKHQHMKSLNNAAKPKKNSETGRTCVSSITIKSRSKQEDSISTAHGKCTYLEQRKKKAVRAMLDSIITEEAVEVIGAKMEKDPVFLASLQGKINGNGLFNESRTMICGDYVGPLLKKHACISMIVQYLTKTIITPGRTGEKNSEFEILIKAESRQNIGKAVGLIRLMNSGNIQFNNFCSILMDIFLNDGGRYLAVNYHRQSYAEAAFQSAPLQQPSQQMN